MFHLLLFYYFHLFPVALLICCYLIHCYFAIVFHVIYVFDIFCYCIHCCCFLGTSNFVKCFCILLLSTFHIYLFLLLLLQLRFYLRKCHSSLLFVAISIMFYCASFYFAILLHYLSYFCFV